VPAQAARVAARRTTAAAMRRVRMDVTRHLSDGGTLKRLCGDAFLMCMTG
jgi:hypothetical protein